MRYIDESCSGEKVGHSALPVRATEEKIESRGGPLDETGVRAAVSPKDKTGEGKGVRYGGRGCGVESRPDVREKQKRTVHKDGECGTMPWPRKNGELRA